MTPATWVPNTWRMVRAGDRVRLPGTTAEAVVETVLICEWHVDPNSDRYRPDGWPHDEAHVKLQERDTMLTFNPDNPVDIWMDDARQAENYIAISFPGTERVSPMEPGGMFGDGMK